MLYLLRVVLVSPEFLLIVGIFAIDFHFSEALNAYAQTLKINDELLKWAILLPMAVLAWTVKEARDLMGGDKEELSLLVNWDGYTKLKVHVYVALSYIFLFSFVACAPWVSKDGIGSGKGLTLFVGGTLGCLIVAACVYVGHIDKKIALHKV